MYRPRKLPNGRVMYKCVLMDINTQHDFADVGGSMPVANAAVLTPALRRVIAWAKRYAAPVVSSMESHRPLELSDSGHPIACQDGSQGQRKLPFTMLESRTRVEFDNTFCVKTDLFKEYQQVIFRKRGEDLLENPKADRFLTQLPVREYILFGTGLETSIKAVALGLLARGKRVTIVTDACGVWDPATADLALRQLAAKGARMIDVDGLVRRRLRRHHPKNDDHQHEHGPLLGDGPRTHRGRNGRLPADPNQSSRPPLRRTRHPLPGSTIGGKMPKLNERTGGGEG